MSAIDLPILSLLNQFAGRDELFDRAVLDIADSAAVKGALFMAYFWYLWFSRAENAEARRRGIVASLVAGAVAVLIARLLQIGLPLHERPLHSPDLQFVPPIGVNPETLNHWGSFPSDHAALFFALSTAIYLGSRRLGILAFLWTLFVVCLPRLYLGFHFPSDIVAGAILGSAVMLVLRPAIAHAAFTGRIVAWERVNPRAFYCLAFLVTYELAFLFYDVRSLGLDGYHLLKSVASAAG
jgi:undecaprenyl-diphosphatase